MNRRSFLKGTGGFAAGLGVGSKANTVRQANSAGMSAQADVRVDGETIQVETRSLSGTLKRGRLVSLRRRHDGQEFLQGRPSEAPVLELVYPNRQLVSVAPGAYSSVEARQLSPSSAQLIFQGWDGEGVLLVSADPETGDLVLEPSASSSRPGVRACRWTLSAIRTDLNLVAPFFQGIRLPLDDSLIRDSLWTWPMFWEAGLAILEGPDGGFWVHTKDSEFRYKSLQVGSPGDSQRLGFDAEAYGPIDGNLAAGGLSWRINVFDGDWKKPAGLYRDWLWKTYSLAPREARRPEWTRQIRMALSWCPTRPDILDALAARVTPDRILIHLPNWRSDPYDENYPTYQPSDEGRRFIQKAQRMGFHVMPHCNSIDMDPTHPVYERVREFQYRTLEQKDLWGWSWVEGHSIGVPESNAARRQHRDKKVMVKIHPGLGLWRSLLAESILEPARLLNLETVFIDVTLTTGNLYKCLVEGMTSSEGMNRLIDRVASLANGLVVGGEGLNELSFQGLSFAQAHLFRSWHTSTQGLERAGGCALNDFLFGRLCRTIGYSGLGGRDADQELRARIHDEHNTIPTITIRSVDEIRHPTRWVATVLERAGQG